jgi:superfamily I DNA and/or RNA helicase
LQQDFVPVNIQNFCSSKFGGKSVVFYDVSGTTRPHCNSYYNQKEIQQINSLLQQLSSYDIDDIGLITPYSVQADKIVRLIEGLKIKFRNIETGSIDSFQGKENSVIVISFVKSNCQQIGFLSDIRRLNVAVSRAKHLLVMIGNLQFLKQTPVFERLISEVQRNGIVIES